MLRDKMMLWAGRKLEHEEVVYLLKSIGREILYLAGLQDRCPMIRWFTDWCLHHQLNRTRAGGDALIAFAEAIPLHDAHDPAHDNDTLTGIANEHISFHLLRVELLACCRKFDFARSPLLQLGGMAAVLRPASRRDLGTSCHGRRE